MTPSFKFLRRVRIHGGECGAVARALHHEAQKVALTQNEQSLISDEKALLRQADLKKSFGSTFIERKQMSTKTSIKKRISLVVAIALGLGGLSIASAPVASAALANPDNNHIVAITVGSTTTGTAIARVNEAYTRQVTITTGSAFTAAESEARLNFQFTAVPGGTAYSTAVGSGAASSGTVTADVIETVAAGSSNGGLFSTASTAAAAVAAVTASTGTAPTKLVLAAGSGVASGDPARLIVGTTTSKVATWSFTPDASGVYKVLIWSDSAASGNTAGVFDSGEVSTTLTVTVGGAPASIEIKAASSTAATTDTLTFGQGSDGAAFLVRLKDAAGNVTVPNSTESVTMSANVGTLDDASFTNADFDMSGWAATNLNHSAAGIAVVTATPAGAISSLGAVSAQTTFTAAGEQVTSVEIDNSTGHDVTADSSLSSGSVNFGTNQTSLTFRVVKAVSSAAVAAVQIRDTSGIFTGRKNVYWTLPVSIAAADDYGLITITTSGFTTAGSTFQFIADDDGGDILLTMTSRTPVVNAANSSISPATSQAVTGGSLTLTATAKDQFKNLINTAVVAWSVSGRNTTSGVTTQKLTDANGISTYTVTDTSTSTTSLTDTVAAAFTFNGTTVAAGSVTSAIITWGANTVKTVEYTVTPTLDDATATSAIYTGYAGASASGRVTLTVLVTGSNGLALAGVPVTFATSNAKTGILVSSGVDYSSRYTGSDGKATTYVYGWTKGATTVTATAGGVSSTTIINFTNAAADARYINTDIDGNIVKATVTDRFGNTVKGVTVDFTRTGGGYFGNGTTGTSGTTNSDGVVEVVVTPGATETVVTASLSTTTYTQAKDPVGYVDLTAITSTGVGASFNTAGKASDTETVAAGTTPAVAAAEAASDAAAEAIDAANAATDAANLAAEAADAATAAVEELATQVATLMAALKAQITTLANTVAKIAKKVKA